VRKQWRLTKAKWDELPYSEQLEMLAEYSVSNEMEAHDNYQLEKKMKAKQNKGQ
jgi:hypothetical protein